MSLFSGKQFFFYAEVAQLVEQRIRNAWVGSSSLFTGTIFEGRERSRPFSFVACEALCATHRLA